MQMDFCTILPKVIYNSQAFTWMDSSPSDDDECYSVQLDSSDMAPNAEKVISSFSFSST